VPTALPTQMLRPQHPPNTSLEGTHCRRWQPKLVMSRTTQLDRAMSFLIAASASSSYHFACPDAITDVLVCGHAWARAASGVFGTGSIIGILWMIHAYGRAPPVNWGASPLACSPCIPLVCLAFFCWPEIA